MVRFPGSVWGLDVPESLKGYHSTEKWGGGGRQTELEGGSALRGAWKEDVRQEAAQRDAITEILSFHCRA